MKFKAFQVTWLTARVKPAKSLELGTLFARTMLCPTDSGKISKYSRLEQTVLPEGSG